MGIDATRKLPEEGFTRPWPKMIAMDAGTRASVDAMWGRLGIPAQGVPAGRAAPRSVVPHATDVPGASGGAGANAPSANGPGANGGPAAPTAPDARLAVAAREGRGPGGAGGEAR
jgi:hypothetical protein